jgi:hypothetical protein
MTRLPTAALGLVPSADFVLDESIVSAVVPRLNSAVFHREAENGQGAGPEGG